MEQQDNGKVTLAVLGVKLDTLAEQVKDFRVETKTLIKDTNEKVHELDDKLDITCEEQKVIRSQVDDLRKVGTANDWINRLLIVIGSAIASIVGTQK